MKVTRTSLPGVLVLSAPIYRDERGAFCETFNQRAMAEAGLPGPWVQDNFSSSRKNVLRGIHYQVIQPQGKLIRVARGAVFDVAVDLRRGSPTFRKHLAIELDADSGEMLWIPEGFGHGFLALTESVGFSYKVTDFYSPQGERTILWSDPELAIPWPIAPGAAIVSEKDRAGLPLREADIFP
jgi:dTDP-4-dehydrorhamnose 3,5-epimerase